MQATTNTIAERSAEVVEEFALFEDWLGKYEYLIELGRSLPLIEDEYKTEAYRIRGCQSQVWLRAYDEDGAMHFKADSDALITKGLIALLVRVLDGQPATAVADTKLEFLDEIGMKEHLSSTRKNGMLSMIEKIRAYAKRSGEAGEVDSANSGILDGIVQSDEDLTDEVLEERIVEALKTIFDPEIPVNIHDLGLIYGIQIYPDRSVHISMTLTSPNCPAAGILPGQVENRVANMPEISEAKVEITFEPPYTMEMMSDAAKLELGFL